MSYEKTDTIQKLEERIANLESRCDTLLFERAELEEKVRELEENDNLHKWASDYWFGKYRKLKDSIGTNLISASENSVKLSGETDCIGRMMEERDALSEKIANAENYVKEHEELSKSCSMVLLSQQILFMKAYENVLQMCVEHKSMK